MLTKWHTTRLRDQETGFEASLDYSESEALSQKQQEVNLDKNKHKFVNIILNFDKQDNSLVNNFNHSICST